MIASDKDLVLVRECLEVCIKVPHLGIELMCSHSLTKVPRVDQNVTWRYLVLVVLSVCVGDVDHTHCIARLGCI